MTPYPASRGRRGPYFCGRTKGKKQQDGSTLPNKGSPKRRLRRKRKAQQAKSWTLKRDGTHLKSDTVKLGSWNVRTMTPGFSDDLSTISDARKTAVIDRELNRLKVDVAALQETRLADTGVHREEHYTFYWKGKGEDETREHGVGFAVRNNLLKMIEPPKEGSERILALRLQTKGGPANIICAYAPTNCSAEDTKDKFYDELDSIIQKIPCKEQLLLLGDFNARVGADHESWPTCLGRFGIGKMNQNGQRLLELCTLHNLCIANTYFQTKHHHKVSWRHPRSKLWHQLDLIITRRTNIKDVLYARSFHSADCDTDHSLVGCKVRMLLKKKHRAKPPGNPRIDTSRTQNLETVALFNKNLKNVLPEKLEGNAQQKWTVLGKVIHSQAIETFGRKKRKTQDWYEENSNVLNPILERKRKALIEHKKNPTEASKQSLKLAQDELRATARRCANRYWINLCQEIQQASDTGNIRGVYEGIKKAVGPMPKKTAPIKNLNGEVIKDKAEQMERWVEHYSELYSRENQVTDAALMAIESLPCMQELDETPTMSELNEAIDSLPVRKAPGMDGIPAEVIKSAKGSLAEHLHNLLCQCWEEGQVPQEMKDSNIITLYKNKGDRSDCNNYRGISLLSIVGKCYARVTLRRLQKLAERIYPESQCGFRPERSTIDMIFSLRQLQERCREQRQPLYIAFIDLTKAFDLVSRGGLFKILPKIGCPPKLLSVIKSFHTDMQGIVQFDGDFSKPFSIRSGVKQGCVLAPTLFGIFFAVMLKQAFDSNSDGIYLHTRSDGGLFNLSRLKAKTRVRQRTIRDMLFADDAAIVASSEQALQSLVDQFAKSCSEFGLTISIKKTEVLAQGVETPPSITLNGELLNVVNDFTYLGSTVADDLSLDKELNRRIGRACNTFAKLVPRVWENKKLSSNTKVAVYKACVLSTLLYGCESWSPYATQEKKLNTFHLRSLRRIFNIKWSDMITNNEVLQKAGMPSMYTLLKQRRLRWLGHVRRMEDGRIPKDILYGDLAAGTRTRGRPQLCYRHVCKKDMKTTGIDIKRWEATAANRSLWKQEVKKGLTKAEKEFREAAEVKRTKKKTKETPIHTNSVYTCDACGKDCHSRIGLYSHGRRCTKKSHT